MSNTVTFNELAAMVAEKASTSRRMSEVFIKELFALVAEALVEGESVTIKSLGTFNADKASGKVVFTPADEAAKAVNAPFETFVPVTLHESITTEMLNEVDKRFLHDTEQATEETTEEATEEVSEVVSGQADEESSSPTDNATPHETPMPSESQATEPEMTQPASATAATQQAERQATTEQIPHGTAERNDIAKIKKHSMLKGAAIGLGAAAVIAAAAALWVARGSSTAKKTDSSTTAAAQQHEAPKEQPAATDTTSATNYLTRIAAKHYGRQEFWIYIYLENKDRIDNPNNIPSGTVVVIPPKEKYGIDPNDKASINKANQISFKEYSKLGSKN